jgi:N-acyl homoserine lactone hydrolase
VRIRPEHAESRGTPQLWWLLTSRRWTRKLPINVYVIDHPDGLVLFDTGQDRRSVTDPEYFPKGLAGWGFRRLAEFGIGAGDTLTAQLKRIGRRPEDVVVAVLSHLHQDHIGGISELPNARLLVSGPEWASLDGRRPELDGLLVDHLRLPGLNWQPIELGDPLDADAAPFTRGDDLFGDGTLILVPTPGHTPGSISLLVRRAGRAPLLMVGDLTYDPSRMADGVIPGVGRPAELRSSSAMIAQMRERHPDLVVLAAHDPNAATLLAEANG